MRERLGAVAARVIDKASRCAENGPRARDPGRERAAAGLRSSSGRFWVGSTVVGPPGAIPVTAFYPRLAEESSAAALIAGLGELTARYHDARAMLMIGRTALARGLPLDQYAFPDIGVPSYSSIGPNIDRCIVYSIARTESGFDQHDRSSANAVGLMQVTPEAGRDTAKRFGVAYDWDRLVSHPVYNTQMGAAEIAALLKEYRGSYILTFAGYNAGRGRVQQWIAQHGDPRDPGVDAVDWVERIPFAETRNYVQRVMENLQAYRARFFDATATAPNEHPAESVQLRDKPTLVDSISH